MSAKEILGKMSSVAESQVDDLESSIGQVEDQIDSYTEQIEGVEDGLCGVAETDMTDYLDNTKLAEIEAAYGDPFNTPFSVKKNEHGNYGKIDYVDGGITDFRIIDNTGNTMYEYNGVNWDSDATITKLVGDFAFGNDYLTKPLAGGGASYGLYDNLSGMTNAKNLLTADKNKISSSVSVFKDYL